MTVLTQCENYSDERGNKIIGKVDNCKIVFAGENSILKIGESFGAHGLTIRLNSDCNVEIGNNVKTDGFMWNFYDNSSCTIGDNCRFKHDGFMSAAPFEKINIGSKFTAEHRYIIIALTYSEICFGEDCMVSRFVSVQSNDGHDIFDIRTGKNISATDEIAKSRKIIVGNHVWIGQDATLLYNTVIGDGSIVGAKSLVKNRFPNNCVIGGNPARILKKDVAWDRGFGGDDINVIDERYRMLTQDN